jgi:hypothetical protein
MDFRRAETGSNTNEEQNHPRRTVHTAPTSYAGPA